MKKLFNNLSKAISLNEDGSVLIDSEIQEIQEIKDVDLDSISGAGFINSFSCENSSCKVTLNRGCTNSTCSTPDRPAPGGE